jgi:hypothetical protein
VLAELVIRLLCQDSLRFYFRMDCVSWTWMWNNCCPWPNYQAPCGRPAILRLQFLYWLCPWGYRHWNAPSRDGLKFGIPTFF